jgi:hypothetical protein
MEAGNVPPADTLHTLARLVNEEIARNIKDDASLRAQYEQILKQR